MLALPIVTPRLKIRPFVPGDAEPMMAVYGDADVMRYIPGGPLPDVDAVRAIMEEQIVAQAERGYAYYAVELIADGSVVGDAGFGLFEPTGDVELGYTFARRAWGVGYATEAAAACLAAALAGLDVPRVIAVAEVENVASHRVAERIGMRREREIEAHGRPHVLFAASALNAVRPGPPDGEPGPGGLRPGPAAQEREDALRSWLACASIEVPACCRICSLVKFTISEAMSTSRIRLSEAVRFSWNVARLDSVCSRRFWIEPNWPRASATFWMAWSIDASVSGTRT